MMGVTERERGNEWVLKIIKYSRDVSKCRDLLDVLIASESCSTFLGSPEKHPKHKMMGRRRVERSYRDFVPVSLSVLTFLFNVANKNHFLLLRSSAAVAVGWKVGHNLCVEREREEKR